MCIASGLGIAGCILRYFEGAFLIIGLVIHGFAAGIFSVYCPSLIKDIVPIE